MGVRNIAAQPQPATGLRPGRLVHQASCSALTLLCLVRPQGDATMMSSRVNILIGASQNTHALTNALTGETCVVELASVRGMRRCVDPSSDVLQAPLSTKCQPSLSEIIVILMMNSTKYKKMAPMTFWTGQMKISSYPASPVPRVSTTQQL